MSRFLPRIILIAILAGIGYFGWRLVFPNHEQVIRKRLAEIERLASYAPDEAPLAKLSNSQHLLSYFSADVQVSVDVPGRSRYILTGIEDLRQAVMGARSQVSALTIALLDPKVVIEPDKNTAFVDLTVKAHIGGERDAFVEEMLFRWRRIDGDWRITHIEPVQTLR